MTILFLTLKSFSATGGIEKYNRCFAKALNENAEENQWKLQMVSAYDDQPETEYFPVHKFRGFARKRLSFFLYAIPAMAKADIIIFGHINLAPLMLFASKLLRKKTICIAHGREVWEPLTSIRAAAIRHCSEVWSVSRFTGNILVSQKGVQATRLRIFYNTLDPFFETGPSSISRNELRQRYGIKADEKVILTLARLADTEQFKGYDNVISVIPSLVERVPECRYVLAGKWDEAEKKRILNLINALKLHNVVILTGFLENSELIAHYRMSDAFVLPSRKEGFGIVFLEAAWCGLPVTGGNRDGSAEALLDGRLGTLIDPLQPEALENALFAALSSPLSPEQQENQRRLVLTNFGFNQFKQRQQSLLMPAANDRNMAAAMRNQ